MANSNKVTKRSQKLPQLLASYFSAIIATLIKVYGDTSGAGVPG